MPSNILGAIKSRRCPECGQKTIICRVQYPLIVETDMKGRVIFRDFNGKRKRPSNKDKAFLFDYATKSKFEAGHYECMACGWVSEPYKKHDTGLLNLHPIEMSNEMACCMAYCIGATYDNVEEIANTFTDEEIWGCISLIREKISK